MSKLISNTSQQKKQIANKYMKNVRHLLTMENANNNHIAIPSYSNHLHQKDILTKRQIFMRIPGKLNIYTL